MAGTASPGVRVESCTLSATYYHWDKPLRLLAERALWPGLRLSYVIRGRRIPQLGPESGEQHNPHVQSYPADRHGFRTRLCLKVVVTKVYGLMTESAGQSNWWSREEHIEAGPSAGHLESDS